MSVKRFGLDPDGKLGLSQDDAVSFQKKYFGMDYMVTISGLFYALHEWARNSNNGNEVAWFMDEGTECRILRTKGGGWQKGRFRIRLEFIPSNPEAFIEPVKTESPLDDLRSNLDI